LGVSTSPHPKSKGRLVGPVLVVLWLAALVAVYFVIVQLKRGGVEGIQRQHREAPTESPASASEQPDDDDARE
jgi:hypothetical protein